LAKFWPSESPRTGERIHVADGIELRPLVSLENGRVRPQILAQGFKFLLSPSTPKLFLVGQIKLRLGETSPERLNSRRITQNLNAEKNSVQEAASI
jgi:hypothetical protein